MSKQFEADNERIPSYEESIATSPNPNFPPTISSSTTTKFPSRQTIQERSNQERLRRITTLITNHLDPAITTNLENGITKFVLIVLPTHTLPTNTPVTEANFTSPLLSLPTTLITLPSAETHARKEDDYKAPFLTQRSVIHDLTAILHQSLTGFPQHPSPITPTSTPPLPPRPSPQSQSKSWLHRHLSSSLSAFSSHDDDPTGESGTWNLGWRPTDEDPTASQALIDTKEMRIHTCVQDVSFRVTSEMGLLESCGGRGLRVEIEVR